MLSKQDYQYFKKAREIAQKSDFDKTHVGCIAVYQGKIIATGHNSNKTHPIQKYYNRYRNNKLPYEYFVPKLHAEIDCLNSIKSMDINFPKVKLYIYRSRKDQEFGMSRPCPSCMAAIKKLGIKHIYYTTNDGFVYENLLERENNILEGICNV